MNNLLKKMKDKAVELLRTCLARALLCPQFEMSSGSEPDGDFGGDVESYDSQLEDEIENENAEREGTQKRQLSGEESEENYEPEKKKHKSGHKTSKKKDKKQRAEKGKLIADIRNFEDLDVDVSSDEEFSEDEPEYDEGKSNLFTFC